MSKLHAITMPFGWVASRCRSFASWVKSQAVRTGAAPRPGHQSVEKAPAVLSSPLAEILTDRAVLHAEIDRSARRAHVGEALVTSLFANHEGELAERQRMLIEDEHRLQASAAKLCAICPAPPPPAPIVELPKPQRRRQYHRVDKLLGGGAGLVN